MGEAAGLPRCHEGRLPSTWCAAAAAAAAGGAGGAAAAGALLLVLALLLLPTACATMRDTSPLMSPTPDQLRAAMADRTRCAAEGCMAFRTCLVPALKWWPCRGGWEMSSSPSITRSSTPPSAGDESDADVGSDEVRVVVVVGWGAVAAAAPGVELTWRLMGSAEGKLLGSPPLTQL